MKTIAVSDHNFEKRLEAKLYGTYGPLAVTTIEAGAYVVTHIATGGRCREFRLLRNAKAAAKAWQGFDWNITGPDDKAKLATIRAQMKQTPEFNND